MSKKKELRIKEGRGKKMLLKLGMDIGSSSTETEREKKNNFYYQPDSKKCKISDQQFRPESENLPQLQQQILCSSKKKFSNSKCKNCFSSIRDDLRLLKLVPTVKINISLSMPNLTQDVPLLIKNFRKRCQSVPPTLKFSMQPSVLNESDVTICSDVELNIINQSDLTVCKESNSVKLATVRSLSLNDLTEDKSFVTSLRKFQSAPITFQSKSINSRPCSPSLLLMQLPSSVGTDDDQNFELPAPEGSCQDADSADYGNLSEGRKRRIKANPSHWKKNAAKKQRMLGESYLGYSRAQGGKAQQDTVRPKRELGPSCHSDFCRKSKLRGCQRFTIQDREGLHRHFWKQLNWDQRKIYVVGLVSRTSTSRKTKGADENSKRGETLTYFLPLKDESEDNREIKVQVCREMFLNTLALGRFTVQQWVKKAVLGMVPNKDCINTSTSKATPLNVTRKIITLNNFFDNIPKLSSHYARNDTTKLFLEPKFSTATELFKRYKEYCTANEENPVSRFTFDKTFQEKNLSLYTLKKDMCDICSSYRAGNLDEADYEIHIIKKNRARKEKEEDKKKAKNGEFILLTMDLEAVKVCPFLTASALYFKTKLTCHNFTVYNLTTHHCTCYWFNETDADLTASTFASFILDYIERHCLERQQLPIVIYSDGCTYQNRNAILSNALLNFSHKNNVTITQKYLEPGHTQMECDSVHSAIERKLKNKEIYLPNDFIKLTKEARTKSPYETISVDFSHIKNYADPETHIYKSIRPGKKAGDPQVVDIRQIMYKPDLSIKVSLDFDADWVDLPRARPRPRTRVASDVVYSQLHPNKIPIKKTKYDHLQQLKTVLPRDCHHFYDSLPYV